jgi:tetratricopeptide (TPR) repeat protein
MRLFWLTGLLLLASGCVSLMPEKVRTYNDDGVYLFRLGDFPHARESFQAALELSPEDVGLRFNLAQSYERMGNLAEAEKTYQDCLRRDPNHADSRQALCVLLMRQGRRADATQMVEAWLAKEPSRADAYALDGWLWHQAGDLPRAQSRLQQGLQFDPHNVRALTELALVYEAMAYPDRALALYEHSLDIQPDQSEVVDRVNTLKARGVSYPKPE